MANMKKTGISVCLAVFFLCLGLFGQVQAAADFGTSGMQREPAPDAQVHPVRAEAGIIEVQSGFVDARGNFWKMKSGSGFLIANKESDTYIITNSSSVSNTPRQIKKFCKNNSINTENMQPDNVIRVVITGDVTAEAEVVAKSAERDYCILSAANVVSQKESLKLGDSTRVAVNDMVCAYGFPEQADLQEGAPGYTELDVRSIQGAVIQTEAYLDSGVHLAVSAPIVQGMAGGPLLDADGYVIGLICRQSPEEDTGIAYALPINEISAVLDNFAIYYGSRAIDEAFMQFRDVRQACVDTLAAGGYKRASVEVLEQKIEETEELLGKEEPNAGELLNAAENLLAAKDALEPKTEVLVIMIVALGAIDFVLFIWMLILAIKNSQEKKQMQIQRTQPAMQGAGYAGVSRQAEMPRRQMPQQAADPRRPTAPPAGRRLRMVRQKTGQTIVLNKNQFIIGKSQTLADYCITGNQTISRKHAMLFEDNGGWYVDDLNSLNGTCVNGAKVVPGQAVRLKSGDEITLSDEAFLVQD